MMLKVKVKVRMNTVIVKLKWVMKIRTIAFPTTIIHPFLSFKKFLSVPQVAFLVPAYDNGNDGDGSSDDDDEEQYLSPASRHLFFRALKDFSSVPQMEV